MSDVSSDILKQFLEQLAADIRAKLPNASGYTASQINVVIKQTGEGIASRLKGELIAPSYIYTLEHGRPPTKNGAEKGSPTLQQALLSWIKQRSITPEIRQGQKKAMSQESLSWAMAIKIHNEGNRLFRSGGKSGVLSTTVTNERIESFIQVFGDKSSKAIMNEVIKKLK